MGDWSSGMIPASGAGGRGFDSPITPFFLLHLTKHRIISLVVSFIHDSYISIDSESWGRSSVVEQSVAAR